MSSDNSPPRGSVRVRARVRVRTPRCGSVGVRNAGYCQFSDNFPPRVSVRVRAIEFGSERHVMARLGSGPRFGRGGGYLRGGIFGKRLSPGEWSPGAVIF